ncbi:hypothetical protein BJ546DRAFT_1063619 [Cryomyces antarcticus]|nr:hypothetical protein LTR60_001968 [Cryomyces antarcticus]
MAPSKKSARNAIRRSARVSKAAAATEQTSNEGEGENTMQTTTEDGTEVAASESSQAPKTSLVPFRQQPQATQSLTIHDRSFTSIKEAISWAKTLDVVAGQEIIEELMGVLETYQEGAEDAVSDLGTWVFTEAAKRGRRYEKELREKYWSADQTIKRSKPRRDKQAEAYHRLQEEWPEVDVNHRLVQRPGGVLLRANELEEMVRVAKLYSPDEAINAITNVVLDRLIARKQDNRKSSAMHAVTADWKNLAKMDREEVRTQAVCVDRYNEIARELGWHEITSNEQGQLSETYDLELPGYIFRDEQEAPESKALLLAQLEKERANEKLQAAKAKKSKTGGKDAAVKAPQAKTSGTAAASPNEGPAAATVAVVVEVKQAESGVSAATAPIAQPEVQGTVLPTAPELSVAAQPEVQETVLPTAPELPVSTQSGMYGTVLPVDSGQLPDAPPLALVEGESLGDVLAAEDTTQSETRGTVLPIDLEQLPDAPHTVLAEEGRIGETSSTPGKVQTEVHGTVLPTGREQTPDANQAVPIALGDSGPLEGVQEAAEATTTEDIIQSIISKLRQNAAIAQPLAAVPQALNLPETSGVSTVETAPTQVTEGDQLGADLISIGELRLGSSPIKGSEEHETVPPTSPPLPEQGSEANEIPSHGFTPINAPTATRMQPYPPPGNAVRTKESPAKKQKLTDETAKESKPVEEENEEAEKGQTGQKQCCQ